ncbi:hypothetical protein PAPHI01_0203 [Pancytospora philotis]|nr:hypothetical protein PAPHI01_0203 [Pancytospora philotis]
MIALDDLRFRRNTIIDLVVQPDMSVYSIIHELVDSSEQKIIIDTQGNLRRYYHSPSERALATKHREYCDAASSFISNTTEAEIDYDASECLSFAADGCSATWDGPGAQDGSSKGEWRAEQLSCPGSQPVQTSSTEYVSPEQDASQLSDCIPSSLEHILRCQMSDSSEEAALQYHCVGGFHNFMRKLEEIQAHSNFVLVIDSITFACDCSPFNLQAVINMLWAIVYECNATVITINHYRAGKNDGGYKLIPRMGTLWEHFVDYQLLFRYRARNIIFTVRKEPGPDTESALALDRPEPCEH